MSSQVAKEAAKVCTWQTPVALISEHVKLCCSVMTKQLCVFFFLCSHFVTLLEPQSLSVTSRRKWFIGPRNQSLLRSCLKLPPPPVACVTSLTVMEARQRKGKRSALPVGLTGFSRQLCVWHWVDPQSSICLPCHVIISVQQVLFPSRQALLSPLFLSRWIFIFYY